MVPLSSPKVDPVADKTRREVPATAFRLRLNLSSDDGCEATNVNTPKSFENANGGELLTSSSDESSSGELTSSGSDDSSKGDEDTKQKTLYPSSTFNDDELLELSDCHVDEQQHTPQCTTITTTAGTNIKHARDNTPCDDQPPVKRRKASRARSWCQSAFCTYKAFRRITRPGRARWTECEVYWDYGPIWPEQPDTSAYVISHHTGAIFSDKSAERIYQTLHQRFGASKIPTLPYNWEYLITKKNDSNCCIHFTYTPFGGLQFEYFQKCPDEFGDDLARVLLEGIFKTADLKLYFGVCNENFVDDGSCEKSVYSSEEYTNDRAKEDWDCPAGEEPQKLDANVVRSEQVCWDATQLYYVPEKKGFHVALFPNSYVEKKPLSIPAMCRYTVCRNLHSIFRATEPCPPPAWPRIVRVREDPKSYLKFYSCGQYDMIEYKGNKAYSGMALQLLWLMFSGNIIGRDEKVYVCGANDCSHDSATITRSKCGSIDISGCGEVYISPSDTEKNALLLDAKSPDSISEASSNLEPPAITGNATEQNGSNTRDDEDDTLLERCDEIPNGKPDSDFDEVKDGGQHKNDSPNLSNDVCSKADTSTHAPSNSPSAKSQTPNQTTVSMHSEVQTKDDTFQRHIRKRGWEQISSSESAEKVKREIKAESLLHLDLKHWSELNIPGSESALNPDNRGAPVVTYEKSFLLHERLNNQFGKPGTQLSWCQAGGTWEFTLRENVSNGFLSIGYKIGEGLEIFFIGTKQASDSAVALLGPLDLFEVPPGGGNIGRTKPYTKEDAIKDWEFNLSQDDAFDSDDHSTFNDRGCCEWVCWDNSQLYSLEGINGFIVHSGRFHLPSGMAELLPPSAEDSQRIQNRIKEAFCESSAPSDVSYDKNWEFSVRRQQTHGMKSVASRIFFQGYDETGTCGFVFKGNSQDMFVALRFLWSLLGDDWEIAGSV